MAAGFTKGLDFTAAALSWKLKLTLLFLKDYDNDSMLLSFYLVFFILMRQWFIFLSPNRRYQKLSDSRNVHLKIMIWPFAALPITIKTSEGEHAKCIQRERLLVNVCAGDEAV